MMILLFIVMTVMLRGNKDSVKIVVTTIVETVWYFHDENGNNFCDGGSSTNDASSDSCGM